MEKKHYYFLIIVVVVLAGIFYWMTSIGTKSSSNRLDLSQAGISRIRKSADLSCKLVSDCYASCYLGAVNFKWFKENFSYINDCRAGCLSEDAKLKCFNGKCALPENPACDNSQM